MDQFIILLHTKIFHQIKWLSDESHRIFQIGQHSGYSTPLRRSGDVDDIVSTIIFLASDTAAYITGVNLPVDGGAHCSHTKS